MTWHGYYLISEVPLGWTAQERNECHQALDSIGKQSDTYAHLITHSIANIANTAWIQEGDYTPEELERDYIVNMIADALNVNPVAVDAKIEYTIFADGGTWEQSRQATIDYIAANSSEWNEGL